MVQIMVQMTGIQVAQRPPAWLTAAAPWASLSSACIENLAGRAISSVVTWA